MDKQSPSSLNVVKHNLKVKLIDDGPKENAVFKEPTSLCKIKR